MDRLVCLGSDQRINPLDPALRVLQFGHGREVLGFIPQSICECMTTFSHDGIDKLFTLPILFHLHVQTSELGKELVGLGLQRLAFFELGCLP